MVNKKTTCKCKRSLMSFWNFDFWNSELSFEERGDTKTQHLDSYIPLYYEYDWKKPYIVKHKKCGGVIETCPACGSADLVIDTASYNGRWNLVCRTCFRKECQCGLKLAVNGMGKLDNTYVDRYSNDFIAILPNTISENPTIRGNREPTKFDATNILIHRGCGHKKTLCSFCGSEVAVCAYTGLIFCSQCRKRDSEEKERKELEEKLAKETAKVAKKEERQRLRENGKLTITEEKMGNLIDELTDNDGPAYTLIAKSENKAVFARCGVYDLHGYKSVSQYISIYSICPKGAEIILERDHSSGMGCVSTNRDYLAGIEIKSVESVFASRGRYPSIFLKKDDTEIAIKWLDGTVENFTI